MSATRKFQSPGDVEAFPDSEAFATGFKKWLVASVERWAQANPEGVRQLERSTVCAGSLLMRAAHQMAPLLKVLAADGLAAALKERYEERGVAVEHTEAVRLAFGLMAFRLPYTGEDGGPDGDIATMRDFELLAARALMDDTISALVDDARSNPVAYRALKQAVGHLRGTDERIPPELVEWAFDVADGTLTCPKARQGRSPYANRVRDSLIVQTVQKLVECGLRATRNEASEATSACDAVSEALVGHGVGLSYQSIAKVWGKRSSMRLQTGCRSLRQRR